MPRKQMQQKKLDNISYREFNNYVKEDERLPADDSPGDTADDELTETLIGMEYEEEDPEEMTGIKPPQYSETTMEHGETGDEVQKLNSKIRVTSSDRPDPENDLDKPTSSH